MTATTQSMQALELANEVRRGVRAFIRETRQLPPREAANVIADAIDLDHEDRILGAARVRDLLGAVPKLYTVSVEKVLVLASCAASDKRLRELTYRQRTLISSALRSWDCQGIGPRVH